MSKYFISFRSLLKQPIIIKKLLADPELELLNRYDFFGRTVLKLVPDKWCNVRSLSKDYLHSILFIPEKEIILRNLFTEKILDRILSFLPPITITIANNRTWVKNEILITKTIHRKTLVPIYYFNTICPYYHLELKASEEVKTIFDERYFSNPLARLFLEQRYEFYFEDINAASFNGLLISGFPKKKVKVCDNNDPFFKELFSSNLVVYQESKKEQSLTSAV